MQCIRCKFINNFKINSMRIKRFKLNALSASELRQKEMNAIIGGTRVCSCSCYWQNLGGASSGDNRSANYALGDYGGESYHGCNQYMEASCAHIPYIPDAKA